MYSRITRFFVLACVCVVLLPAAVQAQQPVAEVERIAVPDGKPPQIDVTKREQGELYSASRTARPDLIRADSSLFLKDILRLYQDLVVHVGFGETKAYLRSDSVTERGSFEIEEDHINPLSDLQLGVKLGTLVVVHKSRKTAGRTSTFIASIFGRRIEVNSTVRFEVTQEDAVGFIYLQNGTIDVQGCKGFPYSGKDVAWRWDVREDPNACPVLLPPLIRLERKKLRRKVKYDSKTVWRTRTPFWKVPELLMAAGHVAVIAGCRLAKLCSGGGDEVIPQMVTPPKLTVTKTDALLNDNDGNGSVSPGDVIQYTVTVKNTGDEAATKVVFTNTPGAYTTLVPGTVTPSQGMAGRSNTDVEINFGTLPGSVSATATFQVTIDPPPLPAGVERVCNQGQATANNLSNIVSDDPATPTSPDPTCTTVHARAMLEATLSGDDRTKVPGDTLTYTAVITNTGDQDAANVVFTDTPGKHTTLVANSIETLRGTVIQGNAMGAADIEVVIDTLAGGGVADTITFRVEIDRPIPAGVDSIANQGRVTANAHREIVTDDPNTRSPNDTTRIAIDARSILIARKTDALQVDNNNNGLVEPGETIRYHVLIFNNGEEDAANVIFTDTPDPNTDLVAGSVTTTDGTIRQGNTVNDDTVQVAIPTLMGHGGAVEITFDVTVDDPLLEVIETVSNQGEVVADNDPGTTTDDPALFGLRNPTQTKLFVQADLSLTKTVDNATPDLGEVVTFEIIVINNGPNTTDGVEVMDRLPDGLTYAGDDGGSTYDPATGLWQTGLLEANASKALHIQAQVNTINRVTNEAEVIASKLDDPDSRPNDGKGDDFAEATVTPKNADLAVAKEVLLVIEQDNVLSALFRVTVTNNGPDDATGVFINDPVPNGTTFLGATPNQGTYDAGSGLWIINTLPAGASAQLVITLKADILNTIINIAEVFGDQPDLNTNNNKASAKAMSKQRHPLGFAADLSLTKTVNVAAAALGAQIVYTISVSNDGPQPAGGVLVSDLLPDGLAYVLHDAGGTHYDPATGIWTIGGIYPGETDTLTLVAQVTAGGIAKIINRAEIIASNLPDPDSIFPGRGGNGKEDDEDTAVVTVLSGTNPLALGKGGAGIPADIELGGNYPNPFNPMTVIPFGLPEAASVTIKVYDVLGRTRATLVEGTVEAGRHTVVWHAGGWPSGVYFVRLQAAGVIRTQTITLTQ